MHELDLAKFFFGLVELTLGRGKLGLEPRDGRRQIIPPLHRRLGEGGISIMVNVGDAGALLLHRNLPVEIHGHVVELGDHGFDIGNLAALLVDLEALQTDDCIA